MVNLELFEIGATSSSVLLSSSKINKFASSKESLSSRSNSSENVFQLFGNAFKTVKMKMQVQKTSSSEVMFCCRHFFCVRIELARPIESANRIKLCSRSFWSIERRTQFSLKIVLLLTNMKEQPNHSNKCNLRIN